MYFAQSGTAAWYVQRRADIFYTAICVVTGATTRVKRFAASFCWHFLAAENNASLVAWVTAAKWARDASAM